MTAARSNRGVRRTAAAFAAALFAFAPATWAQQGQNCDNLRNGPITFNVQWQTQVKPIINELLGGRCTSCHNSGSPMGGLNLSDDPIDAIYTMVGFVVIPGRVDQSILFDKVNCEFPAIGGLRMPRDQSPLTLDQQALIYDWIEQGALGEPKDPIFRDPVFKDGSESIRLY